jgi:hypothetical protein
MTVDSIQLSQSFRACLSKREILGNGNAMYLSIRFPFMQLCQGDCDSNSECAAGLVCQKRAAGEFRLP